MRLDHVRRFALAPAFSLLPQQMFSFEAEAMMLSIGLQESRFLHRRQIKGPARSFWQFEYPGVLEVCTHHATQQHAQRVCALLRVEFNVVVVHQAIEHNDVLAAVCARLLLWTLPDRLPGREDPWLGWRQYLRTWRPGKPHEETWLEMWARAWQEVTTSPSPLLEQPGGHRPLTR